MKHCFFFCVCVCVYTHIHTYIYINIYMCTYCYPTVLWLLLRSQNGISSGHSSLKEALTIPKWETFTNLVEMTIWIKPFSRYTYKVIRFLPIHNHQNTAFIPQDPDKPPFLLLIEHLKHTCVNSFQGIQLQFKFSYMQTVVRLKAILLFPVWCCLD